MKFDFKIIRQYKRLRTGELTVNGKRVTTPVVIPSSKICEILTTDEIIKTKTVGIYWDPIQLTEKLDGISFDHLMNISRLLGQKVIVFTTSGAEKIAQLANLRGYKDTGVNFRFPNQKQLIHYSPELAIKVQEQLGSEIGEQLYRADNYYAPVDDLNAGVKQTNKWIGLVEEDSFLKPIIGGGLKYLHRQSFESAGRAAGYVIPQLKEIDSSDEFQRNLQEIISMLPDSALRVAKIGGSLKQLIDSFSSGADVVYSDVAWTMAQSGMAITVNGHLMKWEEEMDCKCPACRETLSKDVRSFLIKNKTPLSTRLLLEHNLWQINNFVDTLRDQVGKQKGEL